MPRLTVDLDVVRRSLVDRALSQTGDDPLQVRLTSRVRIGRVVVAPESAVSTRVLNRPDDRDADGVFAPAPKGHIDYDRESAWVKTTLATEVPASVRLGGLSTNGTRLVRMSDYRLHPAGDGAVRAIRRDLETFRSLLRLEDVQKLEPGEALALEFSGTVSAGIRFSWPEVLASRLRPLLAGIGLTGPVTLRVRRSAGGLATVKVRDSFVIVVSRDAGRRLRITVRRAEGRERLLGIDVSLEAEANAAPAIEDALEPLFEALTGEALRRFESIAPRLGLDRLTAEERELVARIAHRLGVESERDRAEAVRDAVEKLKRRLRRELEKALKWKLQAGFAADYTSVDGSETLADYLLLDETRLADDHARILDGDFTWLAGELSQETSARTLLSYFGEQTTATSSSSRFVLKLGRWIDLEARDEQAFRRTTRTSADGFQLVTCRGTRSYEEKHVPSNDFEWAVELRAQMPEYRESPGTQDFQVTLGCAVTLERKQFSDEDLSRILDFAAMWGVPAPREADLASVIGRRVTARVDLELEHGDLDAVLSDGSPGLWPEAFAAAMPYSGAFPERRDFRHRERVYSGAWREWLGEASHTSEGWAALLAPRIGSALAAVEQSAGVGSFLWVAGKGHPHLRDHHTRFVRGMARLRALMHSSENPAVLDEVWRALHPFWKQRFYLAASGRWLVLCAQAAGVELKRSLRFEFDETALLA